MLAINYAAPQHSFMVILPVAPVPAAHIYGTTEFRDGLGGKHALHDAWNSGAIEVVYGLRYDPTATQLSYRAADCLGRRFIVLHPLTVLGAVHCGGWGALKRVFADREDLERAEADMRRLLEQVALVPA